VVAVVEPTAVNKLEVDRLTIRYGDHVALEDVSFEVRENEVFGIIGPANSGKTSFLKTINRMDMFDSNMSFEGAIRFNGVDVSRVRNVYGLRRRIGVVFPLPVGLPLSIYDNVALAPRLAGQKIARNSTSLLSAVCVGLRYGMKSKTGCTLWAACCRVDSNNA
jgi:phosphate transport system ATP-binding protein